MESPEPTPRLVSPDGVSADASDRGGSLLEREDTFGRLEELLAGARSSSRGRLVFVGGEAGVGKTSLLRTFCHAQSGAARVLWGGCEPLRTPRPLGALYDIAEVAGGELEESVAGEARPHEVALSLLRELRRRRPTVLVLEDLHWADEATLDVLTLLAAKVASAPALVLASYRDDELDRSQQLRVVLGELVRGPGRIKLQPLSREAVAKLADRTASTQRSCIDRRAAIHSSSPRSSPREPEEFQTRCATRCWLARRGCPLRHERCSKR
jgi:predicted ATPase